MSENSERKSRVPALSRCHNILQYIKNNHGEVTAGDLVSSLNLPRSTVYVLIDEMVNLGLIHCDSNGRLRLWMRIIELGKYAMEQLDIREQVIPELRDLLDSNDCLAVHYGLMENYKGYYVVKLANPRAGVAIMSREGAEISLVHAGIGKCLLAYQPEPERERILSGLDYTPVTENSITSMEDLRRELAKIRLNGWAFDNSEGERDIRCVAVPILSAAGDCLGAISIVGTVNRYTDEAIPSIVAQTKQCAANIIKKLTL